MTDIKIIEVTPTSNLLEKVVALADMNTDKLGFLPNQAFIEHAAKKLILAAVNSSQDVMGYLLYRIVKKKNKVTIVHLCVDQKHRGKNIARRLFNYLTEKTKNYYGIGLLCRRDYEVANEVWQKLGFYTIGEKPGRGKEKTTLTNWWYDHSLPTLFDGIANNKIQVVFDSNIFIDFQNPKKAPRETLALQADWLQAEIELKNTEELFTEINRQTDEHIRKKHWQAASSFPKAIDPDRILDDVAGELKPMFKNISNPNVLSDIKHIAWAIVDPGVDFFVTRDKEVLDLSDEIYNRFNLLVLSPVDLILHIDEYVQIDKYTNMRFSGTSLPLRRVQSREETKLAESFQYDDQGERQAEFLDILRPYLANIEEHECFVVEDHEGNLQVLFVYDRSTVDELRIPIFRVNRKVLNKELVRHLILRFLAISSKEDRDFTRITEQKIHDIIQQNLQNDGFFKSGNSWLRANLPLIGKGQEVADYLENKLQTKMELQPQFRIHIANLRDPNSLQNVIAMSELERLLWPVKIVDSGITTVSIAIDPSWASRWFDSGLASQTLFGAQLDRAFNREGVYYSRKALKSVELPCRILWYVKKDDRLNGTECIRGCSRLEAIVTGSAKDVFRKFQHLGIYEWQNILSLAKGNANSEIAAYRFSDTQVFSNPVSYSEWERLTKSITGRKPNRQSPATVPVEVFIQIYRQGMQI